MLRKPEYLTTTTLDPPLMSALLLHYRIHKIHPQSQIIGKSIDGVQTRRKLQDSTSNQHQALLSFIYKQNRTNHKDQQTCLFACFLSQEEPKKVSQALADESWVEAMQEELLQFKLQEVWSYVTIQKAKRQEEDGCQEWHSYMATPQKKCMSNRPPRILKIRSSKQGLNRVVNHLKACISPKSMVYVMLSSLDPPSLPMVKDFEDLYKSNTRCVPLKDEEGEEVDQDFKSLQSFSSTCCKRILDDQLQEDDNILEEDWSSWQCKNKHVAISSIEAEYVAAASCCAQIGYLEALLATLKGGYELFFRGSWQEDLILNSSTIRADLLFDDENGVIAFLSKLFGTCSEILATRGLATNQKFNFSLMILTGMLGHISNGTPFLMYPRITPLTPSMLEVVTALAAEEEHSTSPHSRAASSARDAQGGLQTQVLLILNYVLQIQVLLSSWEVKRLKRQTLSQAKQIIKLKAKLKKLSKFVQPVVQHHAFWVENQNLKKQKRRRKKHKKKVSSVKLGMRIRMKVLCLKSTIRKLNIERKNFYFKEWRNRRTGYETTQNTARLVMESEEQLKAAEVLVAITRQDGLSIPALETLTNDEVVARKIQAEWDAEEERKRQPSKNQRLRTETIDELRNYLRVVDFEKNAQDRESLEGISMITELQVIDSPDGEYLIIHRANNHFRAFDTLWEILHVLDRHDYITYIELFEELIEHKPPTG
ncbi:hypothetical protein Tco_0796202 [Tanacetum coccineum]